MVWDKWYKLMYKQHRQFIRVAMFLTCACFHWWWRSGRTPCICRVFHRCVPTCVGPESWQSSDTFHRYYRSDLYFLYLCYAAEQERRKRKLIQGHIYCRFPAAWIVHALYLANVHGELVLVWTGLFTQWADERWWIVVKFLKPHTYKKDENTFNYPNVLYTIFP